MISGIFGLTGAGKSTVLAWCVDRVRRGRSLSVGLGLAGGVSLQDLHSRDYERIYSNFPMLGCYPLEWDRLGVYEYSNCLILIDEIMMLCDSRAWKTYPENIKYFMSHHRKYYTDIIWCSQSYTDTDIRIRNLTGQFLHIRRAGRFTEIVPIHHLQDVSGGSINDFYELGGFASRRFINRSRYYGIFDSFSRKQLEPLPDDLCLWDIEKEGF